MNLQDAIDYVEGSFTCSQGAPWGWADAGMKKPYQTLTVTQDMPSLYTAEEREHRLVARLIAGMSRIKREAGYRHEDRPVLLWRYKDKIRVEDVGAHARFYIDKHSARGGPPIKGGTPTAMRIKETA